LRVTGELIAAATGGRLLSGDPAQPVTGFSIDSRTLAPRDLFFAIRGTRLDGHDFVDAALAAGAGGVVASAEAALGRVVARSALGVLVDDTTQALQALAAYVRRASGARLVAITGSAGKTTTKEIAAELLATRYRVFRSRGNLNNHIGLPLSLLELRHDPEIAVVELGMNHAGEISVLVGIAEPDVRVWTNVGDAHLGFFASTDDLARAKAEILEKAGPTSVLIANASDARVMARAQWFIGRLVTFGISAGEVRVGDVDDRGLDGIRARLLTPKGEVALETPLVGPGHLANLLAAAAVAIEFDIPLDAIAERATRLHPSPHRGEVLRLPGGVTVVDDSYNASPSAMAAALTLVARETACARRVAFLGEMLELGQHALALHDAAGQLAASSDLAVLVTIGGPPARALGDAAVRVGMDPASVRHVATSDEAAALVASLVRPGDLVLVKGSRAIATDRVVDRLAEEFA
jgi:UDP-N-acetylmuramoyl-tripeptide--D-alanyl-D-alanine ligase